jgi:DNA (cytosine-5)-methyltransferase 1
MSSETSRFTFVDLFAGIGGMRLGLERNGGRCVYSVEWDRFACMTYRAQFHRNGRDDSLWEGDIREVETLPSHDLIAAGFPCQPFSIAGVTKKTSLGRPHGFLDETQGTLFHEIARLARVSRTPVLLLENVKNLKSHDRGRTFAVITDTLEELGYNLSHRVVDARAWVPQHRERIFIVGLRRDAFGASTFFEFPPAPATRPVLDDDFFDVAPDPTLTRSEHVWAYLQEYARKHRAAGNGFGYGLVGPGDVTRTLSARYYKDGSEILVRQVGKPPRMLSRHECARLMGFPSGWVPGQVSRTQAFKQFGNSVVVPVVEWIGKALVEQGLLPNPARSPVEAGRQIAV